MLLSLQRPVLVLILMVGIPALAEAQSSPHRTAFTHLPRAQIATPFPRGSAYHTRSILLSTKPRDFYDDHAVELRPNRENPGRDNPELMNRIYEDPGYEDEGIGALVPLQTSNTWFETESRVPVTRLWGTRVELNLSFITLRNANVMMGPVTAREDPHPPPQTRSADFFGIGVSIPLGRSPQPVGSKSLWRSVSQVVHDR
ncbi:MAG: hypothetical protein WB987_17240 [Candidatus Acidiferrales bacterium]